MGLFKKKVDILDNPFLENKLDETTEEVEDIVEEKTVKNTCKVYFLNSHLVVWTYHCRK